jgi:DNA-binding GntR family transcriptional regulator
MPPAHSSALPLPTRAAAIAADLRRQILAGELPGGTHLRQNDIAQRYAVSTTPVREAFTALAREGFVDQDAHRGVVVFTPSASDLKENYEIRIALECLATELATAHITESELDDLDALNEAMRQALPRDLTRYGTELSPQFHRVLYAAARRPRLALIIQELRDAARAYIQMLTFNPPQSLKDVEAAQAENDKICLALRARDAHTAVRATRRHLQMSAELVLAACSG